MHSAHHNWLTGTVKSSDGGRKQSLLTMRYDSDSLTLKNDQVIVLMVLLPLVVLLYSNAHVENLTGQLDLSICTWKVSTISML